jgi:hypothetical protein
MYFYYTLGKLDPYDTLVLRNQKGIIEINEYQYKIAHNAKIIFVEKELDTKGIFLERKVDGHVVQDAIIRQNGEKIPLPFIYDESVLKELVQIVSEKLKIEIG